MVDNIPTSFRRIIPKTRRIISTICKTVIFILLSYNSRTFRSFQTLLVFHFQTL